MGKPYRVELWIPDPFANGWTLTRSERRRTLVGASSRAAELVAKHPITRTRYIGPSRSRFVSIKRDGREVASAEPREFIVPSVGELGWTP
jgi:hypothetical protein